MELRGIKDLLSFLNYLKGISERQWFRLEFSRFDAITVEVYMPGILLEVDFFDDHIEYSTFEGDESVHDDQARLLSLIETRGR